ncbi:hypothetical protein BS47DRAFT_1344506 [Hydnum rufescens UP504]|uniref:FAS1 domain-containing protein n=1 Tax=Hydnum rufescens UP504 TaxID=1448309 RepID=A0A9P6AX21_9AGAM|nr:hypothetical protein BS47DRAFT_1344506 [Hydnum rufescens UP504]
MRLLFLTAILAILTAPGMASQQSPILLPDEIIRAAVPGPTLYDLLIVQTRASIFGDYLQDGSPKSTVLVPTNKAVLALSRKPHQGPPEKSSDQPQGDIEISDEDKGRTEHRNVRDWVGAHIIPKYPIALSTGEHFPTLLDNVSVSFVPAAKSAAKDWRQYALAPGISILDRVEGSNGVLYLIDGTVTF